MGMTKIPASYHLRCMLKSTDIDKTMTHHIAFWNQMFMIGLLNTIAYQKAIMHYVDKFVERETC